MEYVYDIERDEFKMILNAEDLEFLRKAKKEEDYVEKHKLFKEL